MKGAVLFACHCAGATLKSLYTLLGKPASLVAFNGITASTKCNIATLSSRVKCNSLGKVIYL